MTTARDFAKHARAMTFGTRHEVWSAGDQVAPRDNPCAALTLLRPAKNGCWYVCQPNGHSALYTRSELMDGGYVLVARGSA